ncbi:hypothetical protein LA080_009852 [Diaporthe eres]|uniref:Uncharacterized protein n=1 Tax=Diaporthe vaccinii TaxID=105482 RepID=A0ABR4E5U5_9PEZI|nr:hypothetical protein LA080_009852 [Diaporthe eres]
MPSENDGGGSDPPTSESVMVFPQYTKFPLELRLQIIEEFIKMFMDTPNKYHNRLAPFTRIHREWISVIERVLFRGIRIRKGEVKEFGKICGKRQHLLNTVTLSLRLRSQGAPDDLIRNQSILKGNISELFHAMKDWDRTETPRRLLTLSIALPDRHCGFRNVWLNVSLRVRNLSITVEYTF